MSKPKTVNIVSDLKQIIKVQEKIIDRKENEFQLVHSLFLHYLDNPASLGPILLYLAHQTLIDVLQQSL